MLKYDRSLGELSAEGALILPHANRAEAEVALGMSIECAADNAHWVSEEASSGDISLTFWEGGKSDGAEWLNGIEHLLLDGSSIKVTEEDDYDEDDEKKFSYEIKVVNGEVRRI